MCQITTQVSLNRWNQRYTVFKEVNMKSEMLIEKNFGTRQETSTMDNGRQSLRERLLLH